MRIRPILFNCEMVRAILDGRKTVTRRVIKGAEPSWNFAGIETDPAVLKVDKNGYEYPNIVSGLYAVFENDDVVQFPMIKVPYSLCDILYVRETFFRYDGGGYEYKADSNSNGEKVMRELGYKWRPSIHMPKKATRILLRVTDVRVERLQEIQERGPLSATAEGFVNDIDIINGGGKSASKHFAELWDSTIKKADLDLYGWDANPWVWVIEFARVNTEVER